MLKLTEINTRPHINELGYEMISDQLWEYLYSQPISERPKLDKITQAQIKAGFEGFEGYKFPPDTVGYEGFDVKLPQFEGQLTDHIDKLAQAKWGPVKAQLLDFLKGGIPEMPSQLIYQPGWTRYQPTGQPVPAEDSLTFDFFDDSEPTPVGFQIDRVEYPIESTMVFDVETFVKAGNGPVMAVAVTNQAWYFWLHPAVASSNLLYIEQLIKLGSGKLIINHNPKFDSARVQETYDLGLGDQRNIWLDTISMHMAVCGMSSKQRVPYKQYLNGSQTFASKWAQHTTTNSLVAVYNHHVKPLKPLTSEDKLSRNLFVVATDVQQFREALDELSWYTLKDGLYTYKLAQALVPKYFISQPHIVSFGGMCLLSRSFLPVITNWNSHLLNIEKTYSQTKKQLRANLSRIAKLWAEAYQTGKLTDERVKSDPWMSQLDWTPAKTGATKGLPLWYRKVRSKGIGTSSRLAPVLLKMTWLGQPIVCHPTHKWIYKLAPDMPEGPTSISLKVGVPGPSMHFGPGLYAKIPHKKGDQKNVGSPLAKDYIEAIETGLLGSSNPKAAEFLRAAKSIAYWTSMRKRAFDYHPQVCTYPDGTKGLMIEPTLLAAGTTSRRCVEGLWLTVSSAKKDIVGSELKGLVRTISWDKELPEDAPGNYKMVGADMDAQELKIASCYADAYLHGVFGSSPMGYTQLLGDKDKKTDGHSLLANFLAMARDIAKNLNFQMLYLSGTKGCAMTIKSQRPDLTEADCTNKANAALKLRRGSKVYNRSSRGGSDYVYKGGTDSWAYNLMMALCNRKSLPSHLRHLQTDGLPRTPMLGSAMSEAILEANCGGDYLTSRANWTIQSSGVDLLHACLVIQDYLFGGLELDAQFQFSYHDEYWNLAHAKDQLKAAWVMQVAHLWSWTYFFTRLGFKDIPYQYMFFSGVNIDTCFRKEVYQSQETPSSQLEVPPGQMFKPIHLSQLNQLL